MAIPDSAIREIRERTDLAEVIASCGIEMKRAGADFVALCPFHHEKTPSFHIHPNTGYYKCFGCGKSGDAIKFLQEYQGMSFVDAVTALAERCGVEVKQERDAGSERRKRILAVLAEACAFYRRVLSSTKEAQAARDYLSKRNLTNSVLSDFSIGYAPQQSDVILTWAEKHGFSIQDLTEAGIVKATEGTNGNGKPYHRFAGRIMFAIKDTLGRVIGFSGRQVYPNQKSGKYVNSPETEVFKKGRVLYGLDRAAPHITKSPHREVILCEGQIDCIRLHTCGFENSVAPQGTAFTPDHAALLKRYADSAVLVFDDDAAGHKATIKAARILFAAGIPARVVSLPDGDDPDTFLTSNDPMKGANGFKRMLLNAESAVKFQCRVLKESEPRPDSIDAIQRISKEVLETVASCANAVLKDSLLSEAASVLGVPKDALVEEAVKSRAKQARKPAVEKMPHDAENEQSGDDSDSSGSDDVIVAVKVEPSPSEFAFMSMLAYYEGDQKVQAFLNTALEKAPQLLQKFSCQFVRDFVSAFLSRETLPLTAFSAALTDPDECEWFDRVIAGMPNGNSVVASEFSPEDIIRSTLVRVYHLPSVQKETIDDSDDSSEKEASK